MDGKNKSIIPITAGILLILSGILGCGTEKVNLYSSTIIT